VSPLGRIIHKEFPKIMADGRPESGLTGLERRNLGAKFRFYGNFQIGVKNLINIEKYFG
jgi:hypothetical protein